jgi:hypothetical protein
VFESIVGSVLLVVCSFDLKASVDGNFPPPCDFNASGG